MAYRRQKDIQIQGSQAEEGATVVLLELKLPKWVHRDMIRCRTAE